MANGSHRTARMIYLDRPAAESCATCVFWAMAAQSLEAVVQDVPSEHVYCLLLELDMEPFRGRRATMMRCDGYRARFAEWPQTDSLHASHDPLSLDTID